jgi:hypothetical protein
MSITPIKSPRSVSSVPTAGAAGPCNLRRTLAGLALLAAVCLATACGSGGGSPTATPTAFVQVTGHPLSLTLTCVSSSAVLAPFVITVDNTASNRTVAWTAQVNGTIGTSGQVWAAVSPTSGIVPTGATATFTVTLDHDLCPLSQNIVPDATYHITVGASEASGTAALPGSEASELGARGWDRIRYPLVRAMVGGQGPRSGAAFVVDVTVKSPSPAGHLVVTVHPIQCGSSSCTPYICQTGTTCTEGGICTASAWPTFTLSNSGGGLLTWQAAFDGHGSSTTGWTLSATTGSLTGSGSTTVTVHDNPSTIQTTSPSVVFSAPGQTVTIDLHCGIG